MSEDRATRVKNILKNLEGIDAAPHIRGMGRELAAIRAEGRRKAEIDGVEQTTDILDVDVMAFETPEGKWRVETINQVFPTQAGTISWTDRNERLAIAEFRMQLAKEMVNSRFCRQDAAKSVAAKANIVVQGRVPYLRIHTTVK